MRKKTNEHYFLRMLFTFYFFPVILNFLRRIFLHLSFCILACNDEKTSCNGKTGKSLHETWEYGNTFWLSFPFCLDFLFHPHQSMLIEVKLSSKSLAFFAQWPFFLSSSTFFPYKSFYIFFSNKKSITKYPNTFDFFLCMLLFCLFGISVGFCAISTKSVTSIRSVVSKSYFVLSYNHLFFSILARTASGLPPHSCLPYAWRCKQMTKRTLTPVFIANVAIS